MAVLVFLLNSANPTAATTTITTKVSANQISGDMGACVVAPVKVTATWWVLKAVVNHM